MGKYADLLFEDESGGGGLPPDPSPVATPRRNYTELLFGDEPGETTPAYIRAASGPGLMDERLFSPHQAAREDNLAPITDFGGLISSHGEEGAPSPVSLTGDVGLVEPRAYRPDPLALQGETLDPDTGQVQREWTPRADGAIDTRTGKPIVDWTPTGKESASFLTYLKTGFVDDPEKKMEIMAASRFPDLAPSDRMARYGKTKGGEIIYLDDDGKVYPETLDTLGGAVKRGVGEGVAHVPAAALATGGEILGGPGLAAGGGFVGEMGRQAVGKYVFGEEKSDVAALGSGAVEAGFSFLGPLLGDVVVGAENIRRGRKAGQIGKASVHDIGRMSPLKVQESLASEQAAKALGIDLLPHQTFESRSMSDVLEYLAMDIETADAVEGAFKRQGAQGEAAYNKLISGKLDPISDPNAVGAKLSRSAEKTISTAVKKRSGAVRADYQAAVDEGPTITGVDALIDEVDTLIDESKGKARTQLVKYRRDLLRDTPSEKPTAEKALAGKIVAGAKTLEKSRDRGVRTIRGEIRQAGGISFDGMKGELHDMPAAVKRVSNKKGVPYDVMEKDLKSMGYLNEGDNLLDLLRDDPEILRRNRPDVDIFSKPESHLTPSEKALIKDLEYDPEEPVYATLHSSDFEIGKTYDMIDGQKWKVVDKDEFFGVGMVAESGEKMNLGPDDVAEIVDPKRYKKESLLKKQADDVEVSENMGFDSEALKQLQNQRKYGKGKMPEDRMRGLDAAKKNMDHFLQGPDAKTSIDKDARRKIQGINKKLVEIMDEQNPAYKTARAKFRALSPDIQALQDSVVADIGRLKGDKRAKSISRLYDNPDITPQRLSVIKDQISSTDKGAWDDAFYTYMRRAGDLTPTEGGEVKNPMGKIYKSLWNDSTRAKLEAAAPSPEEFTKIEDLMAVFKKGSYGHGVGSKTASKQKIRDLFGGRTQGIVKAALAPRDTALKAIDRMVARGDTTALFEALQAPDAAAKLSRIKQLSPDTAKFWRLVGAFMGPAVASPETRRAARGLTGREQEIPALRR